MQVIANNITTRNAQVARLFRQKISACENADSRAYASIQDLADACMKAGANMLEINLQQRFDQPEHIEFAVSAVQEICDCQLCLSVNKADTLETGLKTSRRPPLINYAAIETSRLQEILPLTAKYGADIVLLISSPSTPGDARQMLEKAAILIGAANNSGIPNERIVLDPGIFHITKESGQRHLHEVMELLRNVPEFSDPPVKTTCWLSNSSAGAPARLRWIIDTMLLALLSGIGLSSVFLDVLKKENQRAVRLLKVFNNEEIYADGELGL
jgi:5-methyltetrahydrofolate--homocysteine methyltransferase